MKWFSCFAFWYWKETCTSCRTPAMSWLSIGHNWFETAGLKVHYALGNLQSGQANDRFCLALIISTMTSKAITSKAEGLSIAWATGLNIKAASHFFSVFENVMFEHGLSNSSRQIYNIGQSGLWLNNNQGNAIARCGAKDVHQITSTEKGEDVSIITIIIQKAIFNSSFSNKRNMHRTRIFRWAATWICCTYEPHISLYILSYFWDG